MLAGCASVEADPNSQGTPNCERTHAIKEEDAMQATWKPFTEHGDLTTQSNLTDSMFAFPKQRREPLIDADHVRNALARFDQVEGVSDADRDLAFANINAAAQYYGVDVREKSWRELGR
jgi:hypothetical protein